MERLNKTLLGGHVGRLITSLNLIQHLGGKPGLSKPSQLGPLLLSEHLTRCYWVGDGPAGQEDTDFARIGVPTRGQVSSGLR